jgi:hypothetical protein
MALAFLTQTIYADGSNMAFDNVSVAPQPYIVYNCKSTVNINFLFREVLFCDPESSGVGPDDPELGTNTVHMIKNYTDQNTAEADTDTDRVADVSISSGKYIVMRFINAIMRPEFLKTNINNNIISNLSYYGGYSSGLASGSSINTNSPTTATMDLAEFFQVALSAVRNKELDATTTAINGLVDRENINNSAIYKDLMNRDLADVSQSHLLFSFTRSAEQTGVYANGVIDNSSIINWMKQIVFAIVQQTAGSESDERYRPIRRTGLTSNQQERFMQLKLQDGDSLIMVFKFSLSDATGNDFSTDCPDFPGTPMTVGYRITHSDTAPDYNSLDTGTGGILPVGWELSV